MALVPFSGVFVSQRDSGWKTPRGEDMTKLGRATNTRLMSLPRPSLSSAQTLVS